MSPTTDSAPITPDPILAARAEIERIGVVRADATTSAAQPGDVIDRYKLLQLIGEGGFGTVYMAEQKEPVRRRVALKIIKLGMDTKQVIARFEAERQALAMMDHPNIARVLDAGATETGRPYFVMELVKGIPITEFCDDNHLSTAERLALFTKVCRAVQHAHQKGIIHRDLKPSNVMVTMHDAEPVPKVIDFGIAKAANQELTAKTLFTEFHQFIGTPEYMSPEQTEISGLDVDTRSDVYSLGVLLYELLTGTTPIERERLRSSAFEEMKRIIREEEAVRPSTKVSSLGESSARRFRARGEEPTALARALRGDLDWIVLKALEKDRVRRYETANDLATDIERHVKHEPVLASPPSHVYRMKKLLRRNRGPAAAAAGLGAVLVLGIVGTTGGYVKATEALQIAREQSEIARRSEERAVAEAEKQGALARFFQETIFSTSPFSGARGVEAATVADLLDEASSRLESGALADQPLSRGIVHRALGDAYIDRDSWHEAAAQFALAAEALGDGGADPLTFSHVARKLDRLRHNEDVAFSAELDTDALRPTALACLEPLLAERDPESVLELLRWAKVLFDGDHELAEAGRILDRVRELIAALDPRLIPSIEYAQAGVLSLRGQHEEADVLYERVGEAVVAGFEPGDYAMDFLWVAINFWVAGSLEAGPEELESLLDRFQRHGIGTLGAAGLQGTVAWRLWMAKRPEEAVARMEAVVETARGFERNRRFLGSALTQLACMLLFVSRYDEATATAEEAKQYLTSRRRHGYHGACAVLASIQGDRALELFDTDPEAALEPASKCLDNLAECLDGVEFLGGATARILTDLLPKQERLLVAWERVDPKVRRHPRALRVQNLVHAAVPLFLESAYPPGGARANPSMINHVVWTVLSLDPLSEDGLEAALELAARINEETNYENGVLVDTLARAWFLSGDLEAAIDAQRTAVELGARSPQVLAGRKARLAEYEAAAAGR